MAKEREKKLFRIFYVEQGKTAKECAELVDITEKTAGEWVEKFGWKKERDSRTLSTTARVENIKAIINHYAEDSLTISNKLKEAEAKADKEEVLRLRDELNKTADAASKWNKALQELRSDNKISLETYLHVMERIFKDLQVNHPDLFLKLIDFQEQHIHKISHEL